MVGAARNPPWSRDELILALDLYMNHRDQLPEASSSEVAALSKLLNELGSAITGKTATFRNANGVYMKLGNYRALDPEYLARGRKGLERGGKGDADVWREFANNRQRLAEVASAIRSTVAAGAVQALPEVPEDEMEDAAEGRVLTRLHLSRERSKKLVSKRKSLAFKKDGSLKCEACGFDFAKKYGNRGDGFIEAHHTKPVHTLESGGRTKLEDLALLCANCHRMIHAKRPWLSMDALRGMLKRD
jgi:5-methylcytosine-specific restriction protein A